MQATGVTMAEVDELERRARHAVSDGEPRKALELYRAALEARPDDDPPRPGLVLRVAELHARLGDLDGARDTLERCLEHASPEDVEPVAVAEVARACLEDDPDQQLCLRAAWLLERAGRSGEALELLRHVWEKRTGRRRPAGAIEAAAHRLDPEVDIAAWTPEWPPVGEDVEGSTGAVRTVGAGVAAKPTDVSGRPGAEPAEARSHGDPVPPRDDRTEASVREPSGGGHGPPAVEGHRNGTEERDASGAGRRSVVRRYDREERDPPGTPQRRLGSAGDGERRDEEAGARSGASPRAAAHEGGVEPRAPGDRVRPGAARSPAGDDARPRGDDGGDRDDLRRGLAVVRELIELAPGDVGLRSRQVRYARLLGEPELLEEALVGLADLLADAGAHRGAHLLYDEVLERLNRHNGRAETGLRRAEVRLRSSARREAGGRTPAPDVYTPRARQGAERTDRRNGEDATGGCGGSAGVPEVDEAFRRRLPEALDRTPRELEHLHAATLAALRGGDDDAGVPWRAHRALGLYLLLRGRPGEAVRHLDAARERAPEGSEDEADVLYDLGLAHRRAEHAEEARECFRRLAARDADFAAAWEAVRA